MKSKISLLSVLNLYESVFDKIFIFLRYIILPFYKIERFIPKEGKIIDVGCGHGSFSVYLALKEKKRRIIGMDLNKKRISAANKASKSIKNVKFFYRDLIKDTCIKRADVIMLIDLLHHIPYKTQKSLIKECYNKLRKSGKIIIKDMADRPRWKYYHNYLHDKIISGQKKLFYLSPSKIDIMLRKTGFKIKLQSKRIKAGILNPYAHFIIIAEK